MNPYNVIQKLNQTNSRLEKEKIINDAWNDKIFDFFKGCILAYDNLMTFGVAKVAFLEGDEPDFKSSMNWSKFEKLALDLYNRKLTGHAARDAIHALAEISSSTEWNDWYRLILLKDLKAGITQTTINKVLNSIGGEALKYIIPEFTCQLAHDGANYPNKLKGPKMIDPKLDGVRILTVVDKDNRTITQFTRNGKENRNFPNIINKLKFLFDVIPGSVVLDGEMVSRSFQQLMTQLNRKENIETDDAKLALFDIMPLADFKRGICEKSQKERHDVLVSLSAEFQTKTEGSVYIIPKLLVNLDTEEGLKRFNDFNLETVEAGYEGIMIKDPNAPYESKRSVSWLKIKPVITLDLAIVDVELGTGRNADRLGNIICKGKHNDLDIEVSVGSGFSDDQRIEFWQNREKLIGLLVEVKADAISQNKDGTYSLRFPRFERFRELTVGEGKI